MVTFVVAWSVLVSVFILGISEKLNPELAVKIGLAAFVFGCLSMFIGLSVVKCGGCGKVLFNFHVDREDAPDRTWREFNCQRCGDTTLVKGQVRFDESDSI